MSGENIQEEVDRLVQKERWAQSMADEFTSVKAIDRNTALASARWVCLWLEDYDALKVAEPPVDREGVKRHMKTSWSSSLARSVGVERYADSSVVTIRGIIAAHHIFCLAFGEEAEEVKQLLESPKEQS